MSMDAEPVRRLERYRLVVALPQPAAGADMAPLVVPGGRCWRVLSLQGQLVTSSAAATRSYYLSCDDGTTVAGRIDQVGNQTASSTKQVSWVRAQGYGASDGNKVYCAAIFDYDLLPGWRLYITTLSIQTADQWSALSVCYEQRTYGYPDQDWPNAEWI